MRPLADADALTGRGSRPNRSTMPPSPHLSCFITTEAALEAADSQQLDHPHRAGRWPRPKRSLDFTTQSSRTTDSSPAAAPHSPASLSSSVLDDEMLHEQHAPMTPVLQGLSGPSSAMSSTSSRRNSLTASSFADRDYCVPSRRSSPHQSPSRRPGSSPQQCSTESPESQLIMPSLIVPPRRTFSDVGRAVGKLKILVTGPAGIGKTSLINSITRCSEHIVHVDPPRSSSIPATETFASTKPQPRWKTELELSASSRRRRSTLTLSDEVLDRNICFVDTTSNTPSIESTHVALQYIENQVTPLLYKSIDEPDLWSLLVSGSQPAVDVVLYMISSTGKTGQPPFQTLADTYLGLSDADIEALKCLQNFTNIVPLLARADEASEEQSCSLKLAVHATLEENAISPFSFGGPNTPAEIFAVSNATRPDPDEMDASTLMQSQYELPLVQSDLGQLLDRMVCAEGSAWLRHTTALKILKWCRQNRQADVLQLVAQPSVSRHHQFSAFHTLNPYTATQWWQRVEVADWAQSLRRSLDAQNSSSISTGAALELANGGPAHSMVKRKKNHKHGSRSASSPTHQDPLGLLDWLAHAKQGSKLTAELLSGLGVAAAVTAWLHLSDSACHRDMAQLPRGVIGWWWDVL